MLTVVILRNRSRPEVHLPKAGLLLEPYANEPVWQMQGFGKLPNAAKASF
jgi:hypothetical protein